MGRSQWGPPIWFFFHILAEKIKEDSFPIIGHQIINQIIQICYNLPCPECSQHAKMFWARTNLQTIKTKNDLKNVLFTFHNMVNRRNNIQPFPHDRLEMYKKGNIIRSFNMFIANFNTNGNMTLLTGAFHRNRLLTSLKKWMINNISHFTLQN